MAAVVVWFRNDLRLTDNPALQAALREDKAIIPLFIDAPHEATPWEPGAASRWWLHDSLCGLHASLRKRGSRLIVRRGDSADILQNLCREHDVDTIFANRLFEPALAARDMLLSERLAKSDVTLRLRNGTLLSSPEMLRKTDGTPFRVFTPFWRKLSVEINIDAPVKAPATLPPCPAGISSLKPEDLALRPTLNWDAGFFDAWRPGEKHALTALARFSDGVVDSYKDARDKPGVSGTSRLSPYLHFGELSPRQVWWALMATMNERPHARGGAECFLREVGWREFAHHVLYHFPHTSDVPMDARFEKFPWRKRYASQLKAWQHGQTGVPIVDAGMRELWHSGWMHNRVRMIVASFLTKNLLIPWQEGARWFWDTLVDADLANNSLGWQWTAGCGVDAAPYFRIFNPVTQGERFDTSGDYVRRWIPEIAALPDKYLHQPWNAPNAVLRAAKITLGETYPRPLVDLGASRNAALEAFKTIKSAA